MAWKVDMVGLALCPGGQKGGQVGEGWGESMRGGRKS